MSEIRLGKKCKVSKSAAEEGITVCKLPYEVLEKFTDNFSEANFIGKFQWGKVYRGYDGKRPVVVKKWELICCFNYNCYPGENEQRLGDEIELLQNPTISSHPNFVKLIGYCDAREDQLGVVYDVNLRDSLDNLIKQDSFTWLQRIKVILGFSSVLQFLQSENLPNQPCILQNISAAHIFVDMECNAKLFDFGMISGGIFDDRRSLGKKHVHGDYAFGYVSCDPWAPGYASERTDVFAFGVLLLMLISKRVASKDMSFEEDDPTVYMWAEELYETRSPETCSGPHKCLLVHENLQRSDCFSASDGDKIEVLALGCVRNCLSKDNIGGRLTINEVVEGLSKLDVAHLVKCNMELSE